MKDKDESSLDTKEKRIDDNKMTHKKKSNKILWVILAILAIGLASFVAANNDVFHLPMLSTATTSSCGTTRTLSTTGIQYGASVYNGNCRIQTKEQQDEKRWQDILEASPVVIAASSALTALSLIVLTWQVSRLVKTLSKRQ
jgi:hypothetical protein